MNPADILIKDVLITTLNILSGTSCRWYGCEPSGKQRIYYANHTSHLDAVVVWAALPSGIRKLLRPVAAKDYWEKSLLRKYFSKQIFNSILVERKISEGFQHSVYDSFAKITTEMGNAYSLLVFPEGTRGDGKTIGPFKSGLYHLARLRPDVELVPVFIENMNRIMPKGEFLPVPMLGSVIFGKPIHLGEGESKKDFLERAKNTLQGMTD